MRTRRRCRTPPVQRGVDICQGRYQAPTGAELRQRRVERTAAGTPAGVSQRPLCMGPFIQLFCVVCGSRYAGEEGGPVYDLWLLSMEVEALTGQYRSGAGSVPGAHPSQPHVSQSSRRTRLHAASKTRSSADRRRRAAITWSKQACYYCRNYRHLSSVSYSLKITLIGRARSSPTCWSAATGNVTRP